MKKTILKLGWEFPPIAWGGLGKACYGLVKGLTKQEMHIKLVLPNAQETHIKGCTIIHAPTCEKITSTSRTNPSIKKEIYNNLYTNLFKRVATYAQSCKQIAHTKEFDIIHAHDWMTCKAAINIKKITSKPLILHIHSTEVDRQGKNIKKVIYNIEKKAMRAADKIIAVSNYTKKRIAKFYDIPRHKIEVVHNAPTLSEERCTQKKVIAVKDFLLKKTHVHQDTFKVLFLGRLTAQKGPEYFLKAARKILQQHKAVEFIMAGDGDMTSKLKKKVRKTNMQKHVTFTGYLRGCQIDQAYQLADVYVMPSVCEPFGLAPLEAMKNGTPVIVSKNAGVCEVITNCLKINYKSPNNIAKTIIKLVQSKELQQKLSEGGKREIKKLNWEKAAQRCVAVYRSLQ